MLADTPLPHGFGAALASVDTFFQGLQNSSLPPRSALQATCDGTHGLIEFLLSRQSFSAAFQVARRFADQPAIDHALKQRDVINFVCAGDRYEERAAPIPVIGFAVLVSGGQDSSAFCR